MAHHSGDPSRVVSWPNSQILDKAGKAARINHSSLFVFYINGKEKRFIILTPVVNVIKLFSFAADAEVQ